MDLITFAPYMSNHTLTQLKESSERSVSQYGFRTQIQFCLQKESRTAGEASQIQCSISEC